MVDSVKNLGSVVSLEVKQNNAVNIYENYFEDDVADHSSVPPSAKGMALLKDPSEIKRTVSCIDWHMEGSSRIAVSYSIEKFQDPRLMMKNLPSASYIWDVQKPNSPEASIEPTSPLFSLRFNPKKPETLIGGNLNGLVSFYDTRKKSNTPCASSVIEKSHHDPVYDVRWCQSKTGTLCCSSSTDGRLLWWDTRRLSEPHESILIANNNSSTYVLCQVLIILTHSNQLRTHTHTHTKQIRYFEHGLECRCRTSQVSFGYRTRCCGNVEHEKQKDKWWYHALL